jgi:hypothetical protein
MIKSKEFLSMVIAAALIVLLAPVLAELPSDAVSSNQGDVNYSINRTTNNPNDPGFIWGNPLAVDLTGVSSTVFDSPSFQMTPGGLMSDMYTSSINAFRRADQKAGVSKAAKKTALVGLVNMQKNMPGNST